VREFVLDETGGTSLKLLHNLTNRKLWRIFDVHMHVINGDGTFEDDNVLCIAYLDQKLSATPLHITCEDVIAVLGDPDQVDGEARQCVAAMPVWIWHSGSS
jgi:hypothetical protein